MGHPDLIASSEIKIEQSDPDETVFDDLAREAVAQVSRTAPITLDAQVSWSKSRDIVFKAGGQGGLGLGAKGYLVFATDQLSSKGVTLQRGDKVTSIAGVAVNVYLTEQYYAGHMEGEPRHEYWNFEDKNPAKTDG